MTSKTLDFETANSLFYYDNGQLVRKIGRGNGVKAGDIAGFRQNKGYLSVKINDSSYLVHRVIYLLCKGSMPKYIDHIDRNPLNNRIENLRPATLTQNYINSRVGKNSKSGQKGVTFHRGRWMARIAHERKCYNLGSYDSCTEAAMAYDKAALRFYGEFAKLNYPERINDEISLPLRHDFKKKSRRYRKLDL